MKTEPTQKVNDNIINDSNRCNQNFLCKSKKWETCGKMDEIISDMIIHIDESYDEKRMMLCNYHLPFGGDHYCTCPSRMYIYEKFKV